MAAEQLCQLQGISAPFLVLGLLCAEQLQMFHPEQPDLALKTELTLSRAFGPDGSRGSFQHKLLYELFFPTLLWGVGFGASLREASLRFCVHITWMCPKKHLKPVFTLL